MNLAKNLAIIGDALHATSDWSFQGVPLVGASTSVVPSIQGLVKDYLASFKSVDEGALLGIQGRRAHTLAFLIGAGIGL